VWGSISMLASVSEYNNRYEGLRDYIVGNKRPPNAVPGCSVRPRLPNKPRDAVPGIDGKIKVSSQKPGKSTNECIVYNRLVFTEFEQCAVHPADILPGDVVMLHSTRHTLGHDTNRPSKVASWRQINDILARKTPDTMLTAAHRNRILDMRNREINGFKDTVKRQGADIDFMKKLPQLLPHNKDLLKTHSVLVTQYQALLTETGELMTSSANALFIPEHDWQAVPLLSEWSPDGILKSRGDDEHNASYFHAGGGDSGVDMNVAVQGPTVARNSGSNLFDGTPHEYAQVFDPQPRAMDEVYLLLVCDEEWHTPPLPAPPKFKGYSFRLVPTSARIIEELEPRPRSSFWKDHPEDVFPGNGSGINYNTIESAVFAWRIGSVMDICANTQAEQKITINVNIRPVSLYSLVARFGTHVGFARLNAARKLTATLP